MRQLAAIALLAGLARCAEAPAEPGRSPTLPGATLVIREARAADPLYTEGSISYLRVVRLDTGIVVRKGRAVAAVPGHTRRVFKRFLPAATYRVLAYQRPCDGNCGYLDGPTERCDATVELRDGDRRVITLAVTPGAGCAVR